MTEAAQRYLDAQGLGPAKARVPLGGHLTVEEKRAPAWLCLTGSGPLLVSALPDGRGRHLPLTKDVVLRYTRGRLRTSLTVGDDRFTVPLSQRTTVERLVALARLGSPRGLSTVPPPGPSLERPSEVERAWLASALSPDELLLGWVRSLTAVTLTSEIGGALTSRWRLWLTDRRAGLVALSFLGDARVRELEAADIPLGPDGTGRFELELLDLSLLFHRSSAEAARLVLELARLDPGSRRLEVARHAWLTRRPGQRPFVERLLARGRAAEEPLAALVSSLLRAEEDPLPSPPVDLALTLESLAQRDAEPETLARLAADWRASPAAVRQLLQELRSHGIRSEPWALHLHRHLHDAPLASRDPVGSTLADLELAEHSLAVDARPLAVSVLETRLGRLPSETLRELLPPRDADLTVGAGGPTLRSRVFELLARARGTPEAPDLRAIAELARLHPLVVARVRALAEVATGELQERALAVVAALGPRGLAPPGGGEPRVVTVRRPLSDKLLDEVLRHPATRRDSPLLARLQTLLASVPVPDASLLRDYCEQLTAPPHAPAVEAFSEAATALGLGEIDAYVSRGIKGVGVRVYDGRPPFVLVGGQHLIPGDFTLAERELRFVLGAELAHLRFGHTRITSSELWTGALDVGKQGVELALGLVPVLRGWALADKAVRVTSRVPIPVVQRVVGAAQHLQRRFVGSTARPTPETDGLSTLNETLLVAHRMMQLSADRAGLVISGDLPASLRAMFLTRRDFRDELTVIETKGLATVLGQRADDGHLAYQDLAVRIAALLAFFLSDEYPRLRSAIVA